MHEGLILAVHERGFGFIGEPNKPDIFFHCSELSDDLPFDQQLVGRRVLFSVCETIKGRSAQDICAAE